MNFLIEIHALKCKPTESFATTCKLEPISSDVTINRKLMAVNRTWYKLRLNSSVNVTWGYRRRQPLNLALATFKGSPSVTAGLSFKCQSVWTALSPLLLCVLMVSRPRLFHSLYRHLYIAPTSSKYGLSDPQHTTDIKGKGYYFNIFWGCQVWQWKLCLWSFYSKSSRSNGPGSSTCKNTLYCRFCPGQWQIFMVGSDSHTPLSIVPVKGYCHVNVQSFLCSSVRDVPNRTAIFHYKSNNIQLESIPIAVPLNPFTSP